MVGGRGGERRGAWGIGRWVLGGGMEEVVGGGHGVGWGVYTIWLTHAGQCESLLRLCVLLRWWWWW